MAMAPSTRAIERVSLIVPMRNEAENIEAFVDDVAAQDFEGELELLVADGRSTDGSVELLQRAAERSGVRLVLVDNPARWVSHGLNLCIGHATGDLLIRLDCHSRYPRGYVRLCVRAAEETGADVVGGVMVAEGHTRFERAVAAAMATPVGGIGFYRIVTQADGLVDRVRGAFGLGRERAAALNGRVETETTTYGAFRPEAFGRAGLFDEDLHRNQDDELNLRIRRTGGTVLLDPGIHVLYRPRGSWRRVFRQYYEYGYWKVAVISKHRRLPGPRSLVPAAFVLSAGTFALLAPASLWARRLLVVELGLYGALAVAAATASSRRRGDPAVLVPLVAVVFPAFHLGYGCGMFVGGVRFLAAKATGRRLRF